MVPWDALLEASVATSSASSRAQNSVPLWPSGNLPLSGSLAELSDCKQRGASSYFGDIFGESLGGSQAPPSFWEVPGLPRKFPELPRKFSATSPEVLSLRNLPATGGSPEVSQTSPEVSQTSPEVPRLPRRSAPYPGKPDTLS